jgi:hypothetical protein
MCWCLQLSNACVPDLNRLVQFVSSRLAFEPNSVASHSTQEDNSKDEARYQPVIQCTRRASNRVLSKLLRKRWFNQSSHSGSGAFLRCCSSAIAFVTFCKCCSLHGGRSIRVRFLYLLLLLVFAHNRTSYPQRLHKMSSTGYEEGFKQGLADKQREEYRKGYKEAYHGAEGERKKGLGEKAKEAVGLDPKDGRDPKDQGYEQGYNQSSTGYNAGTSSYGQSGGLQQQQRRERTGSSSSSSDEESRAARGSEGRTNHRKKGLGEKLKETVGMDPKDGRDPKDIGYGNTNQSGTGYNQGGSTTGYNQGSSTTGYDQGSSSSYGTSTGTSGTQYGADGQRHKGLGEKAKEAVGLDPKDGRDPKDIGYNQSSSTTGYNQGSSTAGTGYNTSASGGYGDQSGTTGYEQTSTGHGQQGVGSAGYTGQQQGVGSGTTGYEQASSYGQQQQGGYGGGQGVTRGDTYRQDEGLAVGDDERDTHQKKGMKEKIKEKLGLEPKHSTSDTQTTTERAEYY